RAARGWRPSTRRRRRAPARTPDAAPVWTTGRSARGRRRWRRAQSPARPPPTPAGAPRRPAWADERNLLTCARLLMAGGAFAGRRLQDFAHDVNRLVLRFVIRPRLELREQAERDEMQTGQEQQNPEQEQRTVADGLMPHDLHVGQPDDDERSG